MLEIRLFCSSIIAVPSGPKSHRITVILAVVAPQPRWRHKPWKGVLSLEGTFWLILLCLMQLFTIWYSQAKVTGSQHNSTPTPQKLMVYNLPPLFPPYPSATFLSSCMSPPCVMLCNMKKRGQSKKFLRKREGVQFWSIFCTPLEPILPIPSCRYISVCTTETHALMIPKAVVVYLRDPAFKHSSFHLELNHEVTLRVVQIVSNLLCLMVER